MEKRQTVMKAAWGLSLAAAISVFCATAQAQMTTPDNTGIYREKGPYIGAGVGANFQEDNKPRNGLGSISYNPGFVGLGSVGYAFGNNLRLELEPGYRYNEVDKFSAGAVSARGSGGRSQIFSLMGNVLWDFNQFQLMGYPLVPHIGAGVGWAHLWDKEGTSGGLLLKGHDDSVAYQAIGGIEYGLTPQLKLGLDYRYFVAADMAIRLNAGVGPKVRIGDYNDHAILFTVRYSFAAPPKPVVVPPAPPAPPPPPVAREYTVYFDFNRADITPDARPIIQRAASDAKAGNVTRIQVTGHTDRAGPDSYNQRLSERRAAAVKAELVRDGVPADEIVTVGMGEREPAVPTPDGVREPRNRRVVIALQGPGS
jgi:OOP family OmpA-OmpF porin